jgi:hypothetical protein
MAVLPRCWRSPEFRKYLVWVLFHRSFVRGWFGFVPRNEVVHGAKNEVEFIIATSSEVPFQESVFRQIQLKAGPGFIQANEIHSRAIELDNSWAQPDAWRRHLQPLSETYERIRNAAAMESG